MRATGPIGNQRVCCPGTIRAGNLPRILVTVTEDHVCDNATRTRREIASLPVSRQAGATFGFSGVRGRNDLMNARIMGQAASSRPDAGEITPLKLPIGRWTERKCAAIGSVTESRRCTASVCCHNARAGRHAAGSGFLPPVTVKTPQRRGRDSRACAETHRRHGARVRPGSPLGVRKIPRQLPPTLPLRGTSAGMWRFSAHLS